MTSTRMIASLRTQLLTRKYEYLKELKADAKQLTHEAKKHGRVARHGEVDFEQLTEAIRSLKQQIHEIITSIDEQQH